MKIIFTERQLNREAEKRVDALKQFREHEEMKWDLNRLKDDVRDIGEKVKMLLEATGLANPCTERPKTVIDVMGEQE